MSNYSKYCQFSVLSTFSDKKIKQEKVKQKLQHQIFRQEKVPFNVQALILVGQKSYFADSVRQSFLPVLIYTSVTLKVNNYQTQ